MLFKTTKDDGHWHLGVIDAQGMAITSKDGKPPHQHMVQLLQGQPPVLMPFSDPDSGEEHSHAVSPDEVRIENPVDKKPKGTESERMEILLELFQIARQDEAESRDEAEKARKYRNNDQWTTEDRQALENAQRPALTLNLMGSMLRMLSGIARQNRVDWKFFPVEGSDNFTADILNIVSKHIAKRTNKEVEEIDVFDEQIEIGRSFFEIIPDLSRNPLGEVKVAQFPSENVYLTPHRKKDLSDCEALFKVKQLSLSDAKTRYPDKAEKFDLIFAMSADAMKRIPDMPNMKLIESPDHYGATVSEESIVSASLYNDTVVDIALKKVSLLECERREYRNAHFLMVKGETLVVEVDETTANKAETLDPMVLVIETQASRMRVTVTVGPFIVKDHYPFRPFNDFSLVAAYADKVEDGYYGKLHDLFDCQDEINKRHSQVMDIINKMATYMWFIDPDTFETPEQRKSFENNSSSPGAVCVVRNTQKLPVKIEGAKPPNEVLQMETVSVQMFQMIANVNIQMQGQATGSESNASKLTQIHQAMLGNEYLFDNFMYALREVGRRAMAWAKIIYPPERVARIVLAAAGRGETSAGPLQIGGQKIDGQMPQGEREQFIEKIKEIWADADLLDYDVEVGEGMLSPTSREAERTQWAELKNHGANVPDELMIELSNLPESSKRRYMEIAQANAEQQRKIEEGKIQAELMKARGGAPMPGATLQNEKMALQTPVQPPQQMPRQMPQR